MGNSKRDKRTSAKARSHGSESHCPPGLQYLSSVDKLVVEQQVDMMDVFTGWESQNRYVIKNSAGFIVYYAVEQSDVVTMNMMGSARPFDMLIMDNMRVGILKVRRPYQMEGMACCGCVQQVEITSGTGQVLGEVKQVFTCCGKKRFDLNDARGKNVLKLEGPCCFLPCSDIDFDVLTADGRHKIGAITRHYPGWMKQAYSHADVYGVKFPRDLDVKMKATLLGAAFLIDFMYFEKKMQETNFNRDRNRNDDGRFANGPGIGPYGQQW